MPVSEEIKNQNRDEADFGRRRAYLFVAWAAGACGLGYQVLYFRLLTSLLGDLYTVHAAVFSAFLLCLGLGARFAPRCPRALWPSLAAAGIFAVAAPPLAALLRDAAWVSAAAGSPLWSSAFCLLFLIVPAGATGISLPLLSARVEGFGQAHHSFSRVYFAHNAGAALGVLAVEFLLARHIGLAYSLRLLGLLSVAAAAVVAAHGRAGDSRPPVALENRPAFPWPLFLAGAASAVFQMTFIRACAQTFRPGREIFALSLAVILTGLSLGSWIARKRRWGFSTCLLTALAGAGWLYCVHGILLRDYLWVADALRPSFSTLTFMNLMTACLLGLPALAFFGALAPAWVGGRAEAGPRSAQALWASSLGNTAGFLFYSLAGHPFFGNYLLLWVVAGLGTSAASLADGTAAFGKRGIRLAPALVLAACAFWAFNEPAFYLGVRHKYLETHEPTLYKSGPDAVVLVRPKAGVRQPSSISYNGHSSIPVSYHGLVNVGEMLMGVYPALYSPAAQRVAVVGLGSGITAGFAAESFDQADILEINPAFVDLSRDLASLNLEVVRNPSARIHIADGRTYLAGKRRRYDAVINTTPSSAYFAAAKVYTAEFYDTVLKALKPGGVYASWFSAADYSLPGLKIHLATLRSRFDHCALRLLRGYYYAAICSARPLSARDPAALKTSRRALEQISRSLIYYSAREYLENTELSPDIFARYDPKPPVNTDDLPLLEFGIFRYDRPEKETADWLLRQSDGLGVDPLSGLLPISTATMDAFLLRAHLYYHMSHDYYDRFFLPFVSQNPLMSTALKRIQDTRLQTAMEAGLGSRYDTLVPVGHVRHPHQRGVFSR